MTPEEEERRRRERESTRQSQIAQSRATTANFGGAAGMGGGPQVQQRKNPLQDIGMQLGKAALGSALGPLGGVLGGLFNNGGKVPMQGYNQGGQTNRFGRQITKPARTQTTAQQSKGGGGWFSWMNPNRKKLQDMGLNHRGVKRNMGGPISSNPHGYNEGGQAVETPMKKVMDEDKIELARMAAMRAEERKDMKFQADEKRAQEKHAMDMKMKKQASVTKKAHSLANKEVAMKDLNDPTNVDTIPAMLTEGEFVLNKEATAMYGPLIEKMNNAGLQQRKAENQMVKANMGQKVGGYNVGGLVSFLKKEEGYRDEAYPDSGGVWTIGYGRTTNPDGSPVKKGQTTNRKAEDTWLDQRANQDYDATKSYLDSNGYEYSEGQLNSLASFRYNGGQGMLESLTGNGQRDWNTIREKMPQYNKVTVDGKKVPIKGLSNRREAELGLWNSEAKAPPARPEVPPSEGEGFQSAVSNAVSMAMQPRAPVMHQPMVQSMAPQQPQYIPSVAEKRKVQTYNQGGTVHLNNGGWWNSLFGQEKKKQNEIVAVDPFQGTVTYANGVTQVDPNKAQIQATTAGPAQPQPQYQPAPAQPPQPGYEPNAGKGMRGGGILNVPGLQGVPPAVDNAAPTLSGSPPKVDVQAAQQRMAVPGKAEFADESLLQGSSQQIAGYGDYSQDDFVKAAQPQPPQPPSTEDQALSTFQNPNATPEQVQQAQEDIAPAASFTQAVEQPSQKQTAPDQAPQGGAKKEPDAVRAPKVKEVLATVAKEEPPMVNQPEGDQLVAAGMKAGKEKIVESSGKLKEVFGDLFDNQELARMAVVFTGAMLTGATPGQALSISGQMYLSRVDAKQATQQKYMNDLATGGKYTPASLQAYKESGDLGMLMPTSQGAAGTGQYQDFYGPGGKITAEKVKVGKDQYKWVGPNGKVVDGRRFNQDPSNVRGTPEYRTRINSSTKQVEGVLDGLRSTFDKQGTGDETFYKTDVVPAAQAGKIAEWAASNNVAPEEMAGLVESAYHNAINDKRQDGARVRDLTPYLNQLVIRQSVGTSAEVFRTNPGEDGPPQYLDTEKMTVMNRVASDLLKSKGFKGGSQDLANQFYTAAISDWNKLPAGVKKDWERKANKGENGFYHYAQDYLVKTAAK